MTPTKSISLATGDRASRNRRASSRRRGRARGVVARRRTRRTAPDCWFAGVNPNRARAGCSTFRRRRLPTRSHARRRSFSPDARTSPNESRDRSAIDPMAYRSIQRWHAGRSVRHRGAAAPPLTTIDNVGPDAASASVSFAGRAKLRAPSTDGRRGAHGASLPRRLPRATPRAESTPRRRARTRRSSRRPRSRRKPIGRDAWAETLAGRSP